MLQLAARLRKTSPRLGGRGCECVGAAKDNYPDSGGRELNNADPACTMVEA